MKKKLLFLLLLLLLPVVNADRENPSDLITPKADGIFINWTSEPYEWINLTWYQLYDGFYFYAYEFDPYVAVDMKKINNKTFELTVYRNPERPDVDNNINVEICFKGTEPQVPKRFIKRPVNCRGEVSLQFTLTYGNTYSFSTRNIPDGFEYFIGEGARGGGGGIGCTPLPSCNIVSVSNYCTPSSSNSETNFCHGLSVVMNTEPSCSCVIQYWHKTATQYVGYTSSYPTYSTNSYAKLISGAQTKQISSTGNYVNTIQCGVRDSNLYLKGGDGTTHNAFKTVACNDVVSPSLTLLDPPDSTSKLDVETDTFTCNGTDNTGIAYINIWTDFTGSWVQTASQSYSAKTYTASKTWNLTLPVDAGNYTWNCIIKDTNSPTNDVWGSNRTIEVRYTPVVEEEEEAQPALPIVLQGHMSHFYRQEQESLFILAKVMIMFGMI